MPVIWWMITTVVQGDSQVVKGQLGQTQGSICLWLIIPLHLCSTFSYAYSLGVFPLIFWSVYTNVYGKFPVCNACFLEGMYEAKIVLLVMIWYCRCIWKLCRILEQLLQRVPSEIDLHVSIIIIYKALGLSVYGILVGLVRGGGQTALKLLAFLHSFPRAAYIWYIQTRI